MLSIRNRNFRPAFVLLLAIGLGGCMSMGGDKPDSVAAPSTIPVFYTTDRAPLSRAATSFGAERGDGIRFGVSTVAIPPGHQLGRHEGPSLLKFQWSPDEHKHIKLLGTNSMDKDAFARRLTDAVINTPGGKIMIFVHGYNQEFGEATQVLAQFAYDLKFAGPAVLFSWPSRGSLTSYTVDETNAEWAASHLTTLFNALLDQIPASNIYLVGHSMGNRILARALSNLANDRSPRDLTLFRELVMIAPDIDADVFRQDMAPRLKQVGVPVTLYASSNDRALRASKAFHGYARAGDAGENLVVADGVETIDASGASGGLLGHSYFAEDPRIMADIFELLQTGQRADNRFGLAATTGNAGRHWIFRK